jgi:hypothetical protein
MYCSSNPPSSLAGPIAAAPCFPRLAPPAAATGSPALLLLGTCPDTAAMSRVSSDGSNNIEYNHCNFTNHHASNKVSFHDLRMEVRVVSLACLSEEMRNDIWYSQADIESMRSEARDLCRFVRVNPQVYPPEHTRGLELRISLERQCRKQLTVQGVVEAQRRCADPCMLASLAQRCSMVPRELALAQAQHDFCTVYAAANQVNSSQPAAAPLHPACQFMVEPTQGVAFAPGHPPCDADMDIKMPANPNYIIQSQIQNQNHSQGFGVCNMNGNNLKMASFLNFCGQDTQYTSTAAQMEQQHHVNQDFFMTMEQQQQQQQLLQQQQQQQQFSMDSAFEPLPLGSDAAAATLPLDETMNMLDTVGDANSKRSSLEMWDDPQARMVRPRLGGYPAV